MKVTHHECCCIEISHGYIKQIILYGINQGRHTNFDRIDRLLDNLIVNHGKTSKTGFLVHNYTSSKIVEFSKTNFITQNNQNLLSPHKKRRRKTTKFYSLPDTGFLTTHDKKAGENLDQFREKHGRRGQILFSGIAGFRVPNEQNLKGILEDQHKQA